LSDIGNSAGELARGASPPFSCGPSCFAIADRSTCGAPIDDDISIAVCADGSKSIFIGCGVLHVAQSRTAGNALLISSICSENEPEYGIVWFPGYEE